MLMRLVERGLADLDTPVVRVLPEFRVGDPGMSSQVTLRHLLIHASGIDGDFFHDTGRGDDCLERYVEACTELHWLHAPDVNMSYCNTGYSILDRVIEVLAGMTWDAALGDLLLSPLGLADTHTLPEQVLRYRAAWGHETDPDGQLVPASTWGLPRSAGPAGTINATAADVISFARLHMRGGLAPDGARLLSEETVSAMRTPQIVVPNPFGKGDRWGLGWALFDWDSPGVYGHDGATVGQMATLRVVQAAGVAIVVLANSDRAAGLFHELTSELLHELLGLAIPAPLAPPTAPVEPDPAELRRHVGVYERTGVRFEAMVNDRELVLRVQLAEDFAGGSRQYDIPLTPLDDNLFAGRWPHSPRWEPFLFQRLADGSRCLHTTGRATPKVS
jgi:CubicO group peptidase (beta-lactamase class C family)